MTRSISGMDTGGRDYPIPALSRAKKNLEQCFGFTGIQERFLESLVLLADFMGLTNILHERRNALREKTKPELNRDDLAIAEERNKGDMELYSFACELFASRVDAKGAAFQEKVNSFAFLNAKYQKISDLIEKSTAGEEEGRIVRPKDSLWK